MRVPGFLQQEYCDDRDIQSAASSGISAADMEKEILMSARSAAAPASPVHNPAVRFGNQGRYDDSDRRDERSRHEHQAYPARKKKSFLGEMFDFD